jgi:hypothetical protein
MGWLDKTFKNVVRGAKDVIQGPAGIMLLGAAAPYLAAGVGGTGFMGGLATKYPAMTKLLGSPWIKNALTNAAIQGGIATLTGSKHPWKAMGYSALASLPFTALQSAQAASKYNELFKGSEAFTGLSDAKQAKLLAGDWKGAGFTEGNPLSSWYDMALGNEMTPLNTLAEKWVDVGTPQPHAWENVYETAASDNLYDDAVEKVFKGIKDTSTSPLQKLIKTDVPIDLTGVKDIASSYFTRDPSALMDTVASGKGIGALIPALGLENIDLMAATIPQIAGMYGGRMTEEEKWEEAKEKQIRQWAFQFGIPYDEAKEVWKDGWTNPYYTTTSAGDYQFVNRGGQIYKDDYTGGGKAVGPGTGTSDSIRPVALSDGEFVFTEEATNNFPGGVEGMYSLMNSLDPNSEKPHEAREAIV